MKDAGREYSQYKPHDLAVIGMAGRFPEADDLSQFWENLQNGRDSVREFPVSRRSELLAIAGALPEIELTLSGYLDRITYFEPEIFGISREESKYIDPQQRLLLELVEEAVLDAGYSPDTLAGQNIGIYVAENENRYTKLFDTGSPMAFINSYSAAGAGRVAYVYNFNGATLTIGTACSSALVALHNAGQGLALGEIDAAIVGGVKINLFPGVKAALSGTPILSPGEKARSFDKFADGTVGGEGGGVVFLKLLSRALADGDHIHAIIKAVAVNSDGDRSNGISSPSEEGQAEVIMQAVAKAGIEPGAISYIETHGTGTKIGDPIEVAGITQALQKLGYAPQSVAIASIKSNIGHLDGAAGIASLLKTILALQNRKLPPSLHFQEPNPLIQFLESPVYVNDRLKDWASLQVRRAGVTALGLTGTNVHVILEEGPVMEEQLQGDTREIVTLSARTRSSLQAMLDNLRAYLNRHPGLPLANIAYTLNTGRRRFHQHCFHAVAGSVPELVEQLAQPEKCYQQPKENTLTYALVLPDLDSADLSIFTRLMETDAGFRAHQATFVEKLGDALELADSRILYGSYLYAWIMRFKDYGMKAKVILGFGIGNLIANLTSGQVAFPQAIAQLKAYTPQPIQWDTVKFSGFLDSVIARGINRFILIAPTADLSGFFGQIFAEKSEAELLRVDQECEWLQLLGTLLQQGQPVLWEEVYRGQGRKRVSLPGYAFERASYYLPIERKPEGMQNLPGPGQKKELEEGAQFLHRLCWEESALERNQVNDLKGTWLLFHDTQGIGVDLAERLTLSGCRVIHLYSGERFALHADGTYELRSDCAEDYASLMAALPSGELKGFINLLNCDTRENRRGKDSEALFQQTFTTYSANLYACQSLLKHYKSLRLYTVTANAHQVLAEDALVRPELRPVWTLQKVLHQEVDQYATYCLDIDLTTDDVTAISQSILDEMYHNSGEIVEVAYRRGRRYIQYLTPVVVDPAKDSELTLRTGGVYLITGGTGGIGLELARTLAAQKQVKLILLSRSACAEAGPGMSGYKEDVIRELRAKGNTVELISGDVSNAAEMRTLIGDLLGRYGRIHGVIHTAGLPGKRPPFSQISITGWMELSQAKVAGTLILEELLRSQFLDFFMTCSSLSSEVGGNGFGVYAPVNAYLDGFCTRERQNGRNFLAINWGNWREVGMATQVQRDSATAGISGLATAEATAAFKAIFWGNHHNCWVNQLTGKLAQLFAGYGSFRLPEEGSFQNTALQSAGQSVGENLLHMLREVYTGDEFGLQDRLQDLELDSIDLMQFIGKVKKAYNVSVPVKLFFEQQTVSDCLQRITGLIAGAEGGEDAIPVQPQQECYPVSSAQQRMYFLWQLEGGGITYNLSRAWLVTGELNLVAVERAVRELIRRHESLRTSFELRDEMVVQRVHSDVELPLSYYEGQENDYPALLQQFVQPFDLTKAPLMRVGIVRAAQSQLLMVSFHHIIFDGVSMDVLFEEFVRFYQGQTLPEQRLQYRDYAVWQQERWQAGELQRLEEYWRSVFAEPLQAYELPLDEPRKAGRQNAGDRVRFALEPDLTAGLNRLAKEQGATLFMVLLTAYNALLAKYTASEDIVVGVPVAGRVHADVERIIGLFVNTLALRNAPVKTKTFTAFLAEVKESTLKGFDHQEYPLEMLVDRLQLKPASGRNPLFDTLFNLLNQSVEEAPAGLTDTELRFTPYEYATPAAKFDLSLTAVEIGGRILGEVEFKRELFRRASIERFIADYEQILRTVCITPEVELQAIGLTGELASLEPAELTDIDFAF